MTNRREALKIIGAVGATCVFPFAANELYGQHVHDPAHDASAGSRGTTLRLTLHLCRSSLVRFNCP